MCHSVTAARRQFPVDFAREKTVHNAQGKNYAK